MSLNSNHKDTAGNLNSDVVKIDGELSKRIDTFVETIKDTYGNPVFKSKKEFVNAAVRRLIAQIEEEVRIVKKAELGK